MDSRLPVTKWPSSLMYIMIPVLSLIHILGDVEEEPVDEAKDGAKNGAKDEAKDETIDGAKDCLLYTSSQPVIQILVR